jgi:hypothetical protein
MSHHYSGPDVSSPHGDARLDLSDLYALPKPGSAALGPKAVGLWALTLDWRPRAAAMHAAFVARRLSPEDAPTCWP